MAGKRIPYEEFVKGFWARVHKTSTCWLWLGSTTGKGYCIITYQRKRTYVHRLSYRLTYGEIPKGLFVCHHCDVRNCVRPDHLFLGTAMDNIRDMDNKGRRVRKGLKGEESPHARLTEKDVLEMRELRSQGTTYQAIADRFQVNDKTVWFAVNKVTWSHI